MEIDPAIATDSLVRRIDRADDPSSQALEWFARLFGERGRGMREDPGRGAFDPPTLLRLVRLAY